MTTSTTTTLELTEGLSGEILAALLDEAVRNSVAGYHSTAAAQFEAAETVYRASPNGTWRRWQDNMICNRETLARQLAASKV